MEVGQGQNWGCNAKEKKIRCYYGDRNVHHCIHSISLLEHIAGLLLSNAMVL
jgi:hypothetical protein